MNKTSFRHVLKNKKIQWFISMAIYLVIFGFFMWYHLVRGKPCSLFTANKCIAIASVFSIGISLSIGSLSGFFISFEKLLPYRRTFGLVGAYMIVLHVLFSIFLFPEKFPLKWYMDHWLSIVFAIPAFILLLIIIRYSYASGFKRLGKDKWVILQKFVWLVFSLVLCHILFLGKAPGWVKWLKTFNKPLPPGAFTTSAFCVLVLFLKLISMLKRKKNT